jgi:indolepyruvate ferredoxin oxidoreductase
MGRQNVFRSDVSLHDRYDLTKSDVLLNGTQALVRLMLMQKARDRAAGLHTAGYCTGYRGSPLGAVDVTMARAAHALAASDIRFQPGLNEDLAATAIWGSQQAELRGEGRYDGVFALWYGKGPGVDRSGDVMRHANMAGSSRLGGVVMAMGDDHTGESSTTLHQSDWAMVDAYMPILSPAGVQEILDFGLYGWELSRFAGVWVGLKAVKDTVEATAVVDGRPDRMAFVRPEMPMPEGGLNIRLIDSPVAQEARMIDHKRHAAEAFSRANGMDRRVIGRPGARIGFVAAGKSWLDLMQAFSLLGLATSEADRLGLTTYKVGQTWPMDFAGFRDWAEGLDLIVVVEEKRKLIEVQAKEAIFNDRRGRRIYGWHNDRGAELFSTRYALDPVEIAQKIGAILIEEGRATDEIRARFAQLDAALRHHAPRDLAARLPYFCAGCPHNTSTRVPEGSRAYAGIGCHYMVQWMDRETVGFTQMGGEGANWIGEAPFSETSHVFQNIGDGTYNHSGVQAIRAALAANVNITYKILFNDAVAMTGGQGNDGGLTAERICRELLAMGVRDVALVHDPTERPDFRSLPDKVRLFRRDDLPKVQEEFRNIKGVSAIVYAQTCAAEKRRRRKRGTFADPDKRVFINTDICEGCGDCGVQSNCVAIVPVETELGRKRAIDQSSCNKDFSCVSGFCPSFVTLRGARPSRRATVDVDIPGLPQPLVPAIKGTYNIVITGVGGTGVVTVGAVLAMAAHLEGKGAGMIEMAGLAQKGGAVHIHCRLANHPGDISAIRISLAEANCVIGGDLVVTAGSTTLGLMNAGQTGAVVNSHQTPTGEFTRNVDFQIPAKELTGFLEERLGKRLSLLDASALSRLTLGDTIFSNMILLGAAWQKGLVPLSEAAILQAIALNETAAEVNARAFQIGRWAAERPEDAAKAVTVKSAGVTDPVAFRAEHLRAYQDEALALRYLSLVEKAPDPLRISVAKGYHKLLACKDEYEVARLHLETVSKARAEFDGTIRPVFHLAPPFLPGRDGQGRPKKRAFGAFVLPVFRVLSRLKILRGRWLDPFGHTAERRMERALIAEFEQDMNRWLPAVTDANAGLLRELAELPLTIRGFGPVKIAHWQKAMARRAQILAHLQEPLSKPDNAS